MEREALHKAAIKFSLDLHPSATADVMEGVRDQLNAVLLRYSTYLEGVLISYTQPRIISQQARIHPYFPYFHVDVLADCVLFKPAAGHILDGKVHMVSHDFIGLLVLGLFNVSIGRQHIRADLNYDVIGDCWQSQRHEDHRIAIGTALRFKVDKVDDESEFFTLAGNGAHTLFPKKKKRQKHQDTSSQAGPSTEAPAAPASNAQHRTAANSPAVNGLAHGAAAHSPAVAQAAATSAPTADQNAAIGPLTQQPAAVLQNGAADAQQDGKNVKQKAHKKKKREIDKPAASPVTASAHPEPSHTISQEPVPNINAAAAPSEPGSAPSGSSKKHKKHKEKK
ncbi:MAG: DNA-directed RNA polymerase I subunit rpa43-like, partial [Trebouxia sp. A1-2]